MKVIPGSIYGLTQFLYELIERNQLDYRKDLSKDYYQKQIGNYYLIAIKRY
ncbi:hypothetical protein ACT7DD_31425 [Bacillus paranthracis]